MSSKSKSSRGAGSLVKARPRGRAQAPIDTNLSSYNRRDPFQAFTVISRLLASLSTRIGGCQFKLTPEEHKLSGHLLSIIEPFVGGTPSRRTLITHQPTEILDAIVQHVDSRNDLLSLALSCQRMEGVVIPRHIDYRHIRCKVSSISVWNHLVTNRALAANVRRLEILDERCPDAEMMLPRAIRLSPSDSDLESTDDELGLHEKQERYMVAALGRMTGLGAFVWKCNHSPMSIGNVWPTLLKCGTLTQVEICDNLIFAPEVEVEADGEEETTKNKIVIVLPALKTVSLRSTKHAYGATKNPALSRVKGMLNHCPNLESLDIAYTHPRGFASSHLQIDDLFLFGRWPHLTSLTLTNLRCSPFAGHDAASSFLSAHMNLEVLHLDLTPAHPFIHVPPNALPRLRELKASRDVANAILECPSESRRPLESLKGVRLSGTASELDQRFLSSLKEYGGDVKRVELAGWNEMEDIRKLCECAPKLTWLDIGKKNSNGHPIGTRAPAINIVEWATLLSSLQDLTTFHGVKFFYEVSTSGAGGGMNSAATATSSITLADRSRIKKNEEVASLLAWKCAKLRRLDHWEEGGAKVIVLLKEATGERGGDKVKWEVRRVKV